MNWKVSKADLIIFMLCFPFLQPWWFTTISWLDFLYDGVKLGICIYVILLIFKKRAKFSSLSIIYTVYRMYVFLNTCIQGTISWGYLSESIQFICFIVLLEYLIQKYKIRPLKSILFGFCALLVFNLLTYTPDGIVFEAPTENFLMGIRTRLADLAIPAMGLSLYYFKTTKKGKKMMLCAFFASIFFFVLEWVATALLCTAIFFALIILEKFIYKRAQNTYHIFLMIAGVVLTFGVVFFNVQEAFATLIESLLHKEITLTGRTEIWAAAIPLIAKKWIWGYGFQNQGDFVSLYEFITTSHNQLLQTMYYGGIVGCLIFYSMPIKALRNCLRKENENFRLNAILINTLFVLVVMGTVEICMDNVYFLIMLVFMDNCKIFSNENRGTQAKE